MSAIPFMDTLTGKLDKLKIIAQPDDANPLKLDANNDPDGKILNSINENKGNFVREKDTVDAFTVMYNPSTYTRNYSVTSLVKPTTGVLAGSSETKGQDNGKISFQLHFDSTGASPTPGIKFGQLLEKFKNSTSGVEGIINHFLDVTYRINPKTHTQDILILIWGPNKFIGKLESAKINYKLFNAQGIPIRATVDATFIASEPSVSEKTKYQKLQSPDVTKTRTVKAGDTLLLLTKQMYDDESLYLEVARINNLKNYRRLKPGQVLVFPPINQKEN